MGYLEYARHRRRRERYAARYSGGKARQAARKQRNAEDRQIMAANWKAMPARTRLQAVIPALLGVVLVAVGASLKGGASGALLLIGMVAMLVTFAILRYWPKPTRQISGNEGVVSSVSDPGGSANAVR